MKKYMWLLISLFLLIDINNVSFAQNYSLTNLTIMPVSETYVNDSTNATVPLIALASGKIITVYAFNLSSSGADNFYLECNTTELTGKMYYAANSYQFKNLAPYYLQCPVGTALQLVKGTSGTPIGITLWYTQF